ncbi:YdcH family protein [Coralliovum pocilloporae]|uniref:YdcH family protein n=1 Tax=Coralliovum pocilloporae TaxID=3066369 RepID=UPI0033071D8D
MSMDSHLQELERRHQALERQLEEAMTHPSMDSLEVASLKRKKLQLKDEIRRLCSDDTVH